MERAVLAWIAAGSAVPAAVVELLAEQVADNVVEALSAISVSSGEPHQDRGDAGLRDAPAALPLPEALAPGQGRRDFVVEGQARPDEGACTSWRSTWASSLRRPSARRCPAARSSLAPQPSVATLARSAATVDAGLPRRSRCTRQRIDGSLSSSQAANSSSAAVIDTMITSECRICSVAPITLTPTS